MQQKQPQRCRCNECANRINLFGNDLNIKCAVTDMIEPLNEPLICDSFESRKRPKK